jgi:probable F420-dependent oxidoreductase
MKLSVEFPSVSYREGGDAVRRFAREMERIGYDHIDIFDHVVMGYPGEGRPTGPYPAQMPILEAFVTMAQIAAVTSRITIGTEVLVLPQRDPTLVAKQVSTLDTLSNGRIRLGVGVGWQESEYEALGENFKDRGKRMDEAIRLLRVWWSDARVDFGGAYYKVKAMAMEPKPPQGGKLPIWIGGMSDAAYRRVGALGDGWLASRVTDRASAQQAFDAIKRSSDAAGRDFKKIGMQSMVAPPPRDAEGKTFYANHDRVLARVAEIRKMGFEWAAVNATAIFQSGARSVDAMIEQLEKLHGRLRAEVG